MWYTTKGLSLFPIPLFGHSAQVFDIFQVRKALFQLHLDKPRSSAAKREMKRDLGDVHHKLNILIERSLNPPAPGPAGPPPQPASDLQFRNPFAASAPVISPLPHAAPSPLPPRDEMSHMAQQINSLHSSVSQLIALQTRQQNPSGPAPPGLLPPLPVRNRRVRAPRRPYLV